MNWFPLWTSCLDPASNVDFGQKTRATARGDKGDGMSENPVEEVLRDLLNHLEELETQNGALLLLLRDKGLASERDLAPYIEKAGNASNVKWRAVRARMEHLFVPKEKS
ncbi:MAG: hypothetical protein JWO91_1880 [Acidobacteriaceae bacterium]|nr:hypothetical protein [Acidobacteriaceae bacterium]